MKTTTLLFLIGMLSTSAPGHARADEVFLPQLNAAPAAALKNLAIANPNGFGAVAVPVKFERSSNALSAPTSGEATNTAELTQVGLNNLATIAQAGSGNLALVSQQGRGNVAVVNQSGRPR
ncbi:MAG TPA: curlin repeat-containing protein [Methylovirgula sp.]|jgi:hypothetical protein|nr:curlin repeat-containing protein [Methylovirgula sp.]